MSYSFKEACQTKGVSKNTRKQKLFFSPCIFKKNIYILHSFQSLVAD